MDNHLSGVAKITDTERYERLARLRQAMDSKGIYATLLGSTESLRYFTGLVWHSCERLLGALITQDKIQYILPSFEQSRVESLPHLTGELCIWHEEESSASLLASMLPANAKLAVDESVPLYVFNELRQKIDMSHLCDAAPLIRPLRSIKSPAEIAIISYAMGLTMEVQKRARKFIKQGTAASDVVRYIDEQHKLLGAHDGSYFCIVSFGEATSLPHGADHEQHYNSGDVVLVDTGCKIDGYHSDLTRTYVLEKPTDDFSRIWFIEREAQQAVFDAAQLGASCASLDAAARQVLTRNGLGPDYNLPGLPHRAGHGLGLEIHEHPYIVRNNQAPLEVGMCFSNEPMIVVPNRFGVRLEDHIYMTNDGPKWFTTPASGPSEYL